MTKRGRRGMAIYSLPYTTSIYINNQVLIPASLVRSLGIMNAKYANITLIINDEEVTLRNVRLLRTRHTDSRQFTIPRNVRNKYNLGPGDKVVITKIEVLKQPSKPWLQEAQ